jgi:DNA-binding winged helix-turn-helix (wHTH) protein
VSALSFAEFVLDLDTRELRRAGNAVSLSPKAYELLELLVANRPKAMSKSALQERLWPETYVLEKNLVNLIAEIREALGDDAKQPRFVQTARRFGYAFRHETSDARAADPVTPKEPARFRLVWPGGRAALREGEYVVGRDPDLELFLDAQEVSRRHARITIAGERATIEDLGSKNGTFLGDRRLDSPAPLTDGDVIRVGSVGLTFTAVRSRGSTETALGSRRQMQSNEV